MDTMSQTIWASEEAIGPARSTHFLPAPVGRNYLWSAQFLARSSDKTLNIILELSCKKRRMS